VCFDFLYNLSIHHFSF